MKFRRWLIALSRFGARLFVLLFCVAMNPLHAQEEPEYVRFVQGDTEWEGELQTAIVSFENNAGVQLNLVAAVHLGEEEYYAELNDYFKTQDVVLYELVAEPDQVPVRGSRESSTSLIGFIQQTMAAFLNIGFQLDEIDYTQSNFLHADLTPGQLDELMASKNENFFTMFLNLALAQLAEQNVSPDEPLSSFTMLSLINAMNSENQNAALKFLFAQELGRSGGVIVSEALEQQLTLLGDRNKAALRVLGEALQNTGFRRISIFYGAAHMPGIEREISAALGFARTGLRWQSAWVVP
jgi:hypothetical protein